MRNEFWETRVEGKAEIWGILKNAIDLDEGSILVLLIFRDNFNNVASWGDIIDWENY